MSSRQGLLTRASNRLLTILKEQAPLRESTTQRSTDDDGMNATNLRRQFRSARTTTESELRNVEIALNNYLMAADNRPNDSVD
ncbi:hypothetical protein GCK32_004100 [Trichostrongylus colubriformis]|uniref:Uncharacterized protein n=1 Tax=Trichostrongylus colubriformis TaxID=6319 RepID=A0AAN8J1K7_TRICO